jgi:hypothetical protein
VASHRKRRIVSTIVTTLTAAKRATNRRSPWTAARPQPSPASAESATSSQTRRSIPPCIKSIQGIKVSALRASTIEPRWRQVVFDAFVVPESGIEPTASRMRASMDGKAGMSPFRVRATEPRRGRPEAGFCISYRCPLSCSEAVARWPGATRGAAARLVK